MATTKLITYNEGDVTLEAYVAHNASSSKRPGVLIAHAWAGRDDFAKQQADAMAKLGYVGFALDMYGNGTCATTPEACATQMQPFIDARTRIRSRMHVALDQLKKLDEVDANRIAAIGFCFGGMCVLDLARSGSEINGVVSFHGLLSPANALENQRILAKVLCLHGHEDPMVTPETVASFQTEMTSAQADWQIHTYGNTQHAFTNPAANDPKMGTVFCRQASERAFISMENFLAELFS